MQPVKTATEKYRNEAEVYVVYRVLRDLKSEFNLRKNAVKNDALEVNNISVVVINGCGY